MSQPVQLRLDQVHFSYGGPEASSMTFNVDFAPAAITALMGPSGSGKSTLVSLIAGFEQPSSGRIYADGRDITALMPAERPLSIVFQDNNLFAHLSVNDNVGLGLSPGLRLDRRDMEKRRAALDAVGLGGYGERKPAELSGGERQRVAIARALVRNRPILILDEAFGSLGPALRESLLDLVASVQADAQMTVIMVTHDPADAIRIAGQTVFLENGRVAASGQTAELLGENAPTAVRQYLGETRS